MPPLRPKPNIAIVGATVIDGLGGPPLTNAMVIITRNRISAACMRLQPRCPTTDANIIDGRGKFISHRLFNTNTHLLLFGAAARYIRLWETIVRYEHQNADLALEAAHLHLKYETTTVMDSFGSLIPFVLVRDAINRGEKIESRILAASNIVGWGPSLDHPLSYQRR